MYFRITLHFRWNSLNFYNVNGFSSVWRQLTLVFIDQINYILLNIFSVTDEILARCHNNNMQCTLHSFKWYFCESVFSLLWRIALIDANVLYISAAHIIIASGHPIVKYLSPTSL